MWNGLADFIDRLPSLIGKLSLPLLAVGAALEIALRYQIIPVAAWNGRVADTAPVLWVVGLGLLVCWALLEAMKAPGHLRRAKAVREHKRQIRQNVGFLSPDARLLLYFTIRYQGGRCPALFDFQAFKDLQAYGLLELETDFIDAGYNSAGTYRLAKAIDDPSDLASKLDPILRSHFRINLDEVSEVGAQLRQRHTPVGTY